MGSWGYSALEDDTACDWVGQFVDNPCSGAIQTALQQALGSEYVDDFVGPRALAAAEVVAALNRKSSSRLDKSASEWASKQPSPEESLLTLAKTAVQRIVSESELRDIWSDSNAIEQWESAMEELISRLS